MRKTPDFQAKIKIFRIISEKRLKAVKSKKKIDSKSIIKDIESLKNDQLFKFLLEPVNSVAIPVEDQKFDNDFVEEQSRLDKPIEPSLLRKKVAPQTCAINKNELASIVKYDLTQKLHEFYAQLDETADDKRESFQIFGELQQLALELEQQSLQEKTQEGEESKALLDNESEKSGDEGEAERVSSLPPGSWIQFAPEGSQGPEDQVVPAVTPRNV